MQTLLLALGNQWVRLVLAAVLAFGVGWVKGFNAVPRVDIAAIERNAIAGRDAHWQAKITEENEAHDIALKAALAAAEPVPAVPADAPGLSKLCDRPGSACRDKSPNRR